MESRTTSHWLVAHREFAAMQCCPTGKKLTTTGTLVNDGAALLYGASKVRLKGLRPEGEVQSPRAGPQDAALAPGTFTSSRPATAAAL